MLASNDIVFQKEGLVRQVMWDELTHEIYKKKLLTGQMDFSIAVSVFDDSFYNV